jgi:hypothetical protein
MFRELAVIAPVALLLSLPYAQGVAEERNAPALSGQLEEISATLRRLEAQMAQVLEEQARLAAAVAALSAQAGASPAARAVPSVSGPASRASLPQVLEIEVLGGVSGDELAAIVSWVRRVHATHRSSRIVVEPVMPLDSADPAGQRRRLMDEVGRVIDHVFAQLHQRVDISSLVAESVPGPRLRLAFSAG